MHRKIFSVSHCKADKAEEMEESTDEQEISQRLNTKLMDPEKFAYVQQYLQDIPETHSMTTETSDSDYWTRTTASETSGKFNSTIFILIGSTVAASSALDSGLRDSGSIPGLF